VPYFQKDSGIRPQETRNNQTTRSHNSQQHDKQTRHLLNPAVHFTTKPICWMFSVLSSPSTTKFIPAVRPFSLCFHESFPLRKENSQTTGLKLGDKTEMDVSEESTAASSQRAWKQQVPPTCWHGLHIYQTTSQ